MTSVRLCSDGMWPGRSIEFRAGDGRIWTMFAIAGGANATLSVIAKFGYPVVTRN